MPTLIRGDRLSPTTRAAVLRQFVYRWTRENPQRVAAYGPCHLCDIRDPYVNTESANGHTHPTIPLQSDAEWLAEHAFYVNRDGRLSERHRHCEPAFMDEDDAIRPATVQA